MHETYQTQAAHRTVVNVTRKAMRDAMKDAARDAAKPQRVKRLVLLLFLVAALVAVAPSQSKAAAPIPEIGYLDLFKTIAQARGQVVVVNFFATWCPACKKLYPTLQATRQKYSGEEIVMVGVSVDEDPKALSSYVKKRGFNYPIFHATQELATIFQVSSIPKTLIYNKKGQLALNSDGVLSPEDFHRAIDGLLQQ